MTQTETTAFPLQWDDPADAERIWMFDAMHTPHVQTPLGFELYMEPFLRGFGMVRSCQQNYYAYMHMLEMPPVGGAVEPEVVKMGGRRWREEILPEVLSLTKHYRESDFDAISPAELAAEIDRLAEVRVRSGQLHTLAIMPCFMGMNLLIDTFRELTGGDDLQAMRLVQGHGSKSTEAGHALCQIARTAGGIPVVRQTLLAKDGGSATGRLQALAGQPDARPFLDAFNDYLDEFGWRSSLFELADPTWAEDPAVPLDLVKAYLDMPAYDPKAEQERLSAERETALAETLAPLGPEEAARLQAAVDAAKDVVMLQEDHNFFIDQRLGTLPRRLILATGRWLAAAGALEKAEDVFYLKHKELTAALLGDAAGLARAVATRKAEMEHWRGVTPPAFVGAPPLPDPPGDLNRFWGNKVSSERKDELRGNPASAGIARGTARVIATLDEAHRLGQRDILVTRTTMPPWTPLFAVAGAIVTETGGVLSHAAVTAREYGLPAVLNVTDATRLIKDGQAIEVDGTRGTVRILS